MSDINWEFDEVVDLIQEQLTYAQTVALMKLLQEIVKEEV
jgi:RNA processing factor Prp31